MNFSPDIRQYGPKQTLYSAAVAIALALAAGPALAQSGQSDQTQGQNQQKGGPDVTVDQAPPKVSIVQPQPTVTVKQPPPNVTVTQPAPEVSVNVPKPQVKVTQPKPDVQVTMPKPKVRVQQAQPDVNVDRNPPDIQVQNAQPKVRVQQSGHSNIQYQSSGQPKVTVHQKKAQVNVQKGQSQGGNNQTLVSKKGSEVIGQQLMTSGGQQAGQISNLVASKQNDRIFAVVSVNGSSSNKVVIPLQQIQLKQGQLQTSQGMQQLKQAKKYQKSQYQPIERNMPLHQYTIQ